MTSPEDVIPTTIGPRLEISTARYEFLNRHQYMQQQGLDNADMCPIGPVTIRVE